MGEIIKQANLPLTLLNLTSNHSHFHASVLSISPVFITKYSIPVAHSP